MITGSASPMKCNERTYDVPGAPIVLANIRSIRVRVIDFDAID
uniref:Uncharacterized protein n=1 Tax=Anopheles albimanus TaxID=7167 RepID=A0A182FYP5_ANOAL